MGTPVASTPPPTTPRPEPSRRFCCAPMMDWSDRHCRFFWRLLTRQALLYTEMVTTGALIHGDRERFLRFSPAEQPVALQLGGSDPAALAACARMAQDYGYNEVNLNCGCPSDRVQNGMIGACLMAEPALVRDCMSAMIEAVDIPVTIKHRIGIDEMEDYEGLVHFVETVAASGCQTFIVHARKAWLQGLSPKQNREVPPLRYELVQALKQDFPQLEIILNGGITTLAQCQTLLQSLDGVMLGREVYANPYLLAEVDSLIYGDTAPMPSREAVLDDFIAYARTELEAGTRLSHLSRHVLGLYHNQPGARRFRRHISENAHKKGAGIEVLERARALMQP